VYVKIYACQELPISFFSPPPQAQPRIGCGNRFFASAGLHAAAKSG
jgi:hypothetical protein